MYLSRTVGLAWSMKAEMAAGFVIDALVMVIWRCSQGYLSSL